MRCQRQCTMTTPTSGMMYLTIQELSARIKHDVHTIRNQLKHSVLLERAHSGNGAEQAIRGAAPEAAPCSSSAVGKGEAKLQIGSTRYSRDCKGARHSVPAARKKHPHKHIVIIKHKVFAGAADVQQDCKKQYSSSGGVKPIRQVPQRWV